MYGGGITQCASPDGRDLDSEMVDLRQLRSLGSTFNPFLLVERIDNGLVFSIEIVDPVRSVTV